MEEKKRALVGPKQLKNPERQTPSDFKAWKQSFVALGSALLA